MYKLLLCLRYLRTRYIALASIISVTLGVWVMIVVNSVMEGFTSEMQNRIHGVLSDITFSSINFDGMPDADWHEEQIRGVAGDQIEALSPTVVTPAILSYHWGGQIVTNVVTLIGIDEKTQNAVSDFGKYLQHPENRRAMSFELREGGYDVRDHQSGGEIPVRKPMVTAGWKWRREMAQIQAFQEPYRTPEQKPPQNSPLPKGEGRGVRAADPFTGRNAEQAAEKVFDPAHEQHTGLVLGIALASFRTPAGEDKFRIVPGDDVKIACFGAGQRPEAKADSFTVVDLYESKMSEYDSQFVFVPIRELQRLRGMIDPQTGKGMVNTIQIRLKPGVSAEEVRNKLQAHFGNGLFQIQTWRDRQGPLLAAVQMEKRILNLLLFMIIAVAGFGILAIFYMIVVEKTRDIGILKSLGASGRGVMGIFLAYGLSLGVIGSGVGLVCGLLFVRYINEVAAALGWITGLPVFDPSIYYFYKIPAIVVPGTVAWIVAGALLIATAASILPARRAARLHPVEALRYE